jgi:SPP1 gp7 family putative phage head morphogenesis protein/excisionase family DNA binding protein
MMETIRFTMDNLHILALDTEDTIGESKRDVSGLEKLIEKFVDGLVRATDMPRTVLLGEQPGGLGANAASEIRSWYDHVHAKQRMVLTPVINRILEVMLNIRANRGEAVPTEWQVEWKQLWQPTAQEVSQTRLSTAQADQIYFSIGAMSIDEIRTRLEADGEIGDANAPVPPPPTSINTGSPPGGSLELASADAENLEVPPSTAPTPDDLCSVREAAQAFGVPTRTLSRLCETGKLSFWQFGARKQVSMEEVSQLGRREHVPDDRLDQGEGGLGQGFPEARAEALEQKYGRLNEIAMRVAVRKVIPAVVSGSDGAIDDAVDDVQDEVDRRFGDDVVEREAEKAGGSLTEEHGKTFFAALGLAVGSQIVGGDSDTQGIPRGEVLPPPGVPGPDGQPVSRARIGVRVNLQPQLFASEFTAENVELIGTLRAGIKEGLSDAIVRAKQFGGTPEETADRLLKQWEKNGIPSKIPINRVNKKGERVLISTEKHSRLIAHDQINKLNGRLNQTRQEAAGVTEFIWRTQGDSLVREEHAAINGQKFLWAEGAPIEGLPGEPINCRCHAEPAIDKDQILLSGDFVEL